MKTWKVLVHPVRARIVGCLAGRRLTRKQLEELIPEVPPPSLYRNLQVLVGHGVVEPVERIPRRGVEQLVYTLVEGAARVHGDEAAEQGPSEWVQALELFFQQLTMAYRRNLAEGGGEPAPGAAHFVYLRPEQVNELRERLWGVLREYPSEAADGTKRYIVAEAVIPD